MEYSIPQPKVCSFWNCYSNFQRPICEHPCNSFYSSFSKDVLDSFKAKRNPFSDVFKQILSSVPAQYICFAELLPQIVCTKDEAHFSVILDQSSKSSCYNNQAVHAEITRNSLIA